MVPGRGYQVEGTEAQLREVTGWQPQTRVMLCPWRPSCQLSVPISELAACAHTRAVGTVVTSFL